MVSGYLRIYTNFQMCYFKCQRKISLATEEWEKLLSATLEEIVGKWSSKILSFTLSLIFLPFGTTTENRSPQHCSQSLHHSVILRLLRNTSRRIQGSDHVSFFFNISVQMAVSFPCYKQGWTSQKQFISFYLTLEPGGLPFLWILSCPFTILEAKVLTPTWRW